MTRIISSSAMMFSPDPAGFALTVVGEFSTFHSICGLDIKVFFLSADGHIIPPVFTAGTIASYISSAAEAGFVADVVCNDTEYS